MRVTVLVFNGVTTREVLGPIRALGDAAEPAVRLAALTPSAKHGFEPLHTFRPDVGLDQVEWTDLLLVPGGLGSVSMMEEPTVIAWLRSQAAQSRFVLSVSTGSLLLAAAELLTDRDATGHWLAMDTLQKAGAHAVEDPISWRGNLVTTASTVAAIEVAATLPDRIAFGPPDQ